MITDHLDTTRTQSFTYDELNRLKTANSSAYGTITYDYYPNGNIQYNSRVGTYTYDPNHPHQVSQAGPHQFYYDDNGNMIYGREIWLNYNYDNLPELIWYSDAFDFRYDYNRQKVKKMSWDTGQTTIYIGKLYECTDGVCTKHIFAGNQRIASKTGTETYYYHTDHLGSSNVITNSTGEMVQEIYYYPFGETRFSSGSANPKYKYTGQEEEINSRLYDYGARYYDPIIGRFISADTIVPFPGNPQSLNRYAYVLNNPVIYTDPTGHFSLKKFFKSFFTGVVSAAVFVLSGGT